MKIYENVKRECGECNACCKVFKIPEVEKNDGSLCKHWAAGRGCQIYTTRPEACRLFACVWRNGRGDDDFRPDRIGVMTDVEDYEILGFTYGILHLWEVRPGAIEQQTIAGLIEDNKAAGFVVATHRLMPNNTYFLCVSQQSDLFDPCDLAILRAYLNKDPGLVNIEGLR